MTGDRRPVLLDMHRDIVPTSHSDAVVPALANLAWDGGIDLITTQRGRNPTV